MSRWWHCDSHRPTLKAPLVGGIALQLLAPSHSDSASSILCSYIFPGRNRLGDRPTGHAQCSDPALTARPAALSRQCASLQCPGPFKSVPLVARQQCGQRWSCTAEAWPWSRPCQAAVANTYQGAASCRWWPASGESGQGSPGRTHTSSSCGRRKPITSGVRPWTSGREVGEVLKEMDSRRKHWEENMFTPFFNAQDVLGETSQLQSSSKPIAIEKIKRTEIICDLSSRKFQDGSDFKRKEYTSQVEKREHGQNSRERRINMTKNVADTNSSPCEASNLDVAAKTDFPRTEGPSIWSKKKFPTVLQQDTRKTWTSGMPPKLRLILLHEEMKELTMTCRKLEEEFETAEKELLNSRRVVPRKSVNFQEAGSDTPKKDWELQALKNDLSVKTTNVKNLTEELQRAKEIIHKLHLENRSLKEAMRKLKHHTQVGNTLLKEEMKLYYELDMEKIRAEIDAIKNELRAEKTLQARNNRALEVFRKHFASKIRTSSPFHDFIGDVL